MYLLIAGGGKVGSNLARTLIRTGHEVTVIEQRDSRYIVLERAGIGRPAEIVIAVTGDDEDNLVIGQLSREKYQVERVIARVNDPRNEPHFDLLGISPTVSATSMVLALVEHEVPQHELVHLLEPFVPVGALLEECHLVTAAEQRPRNGCADLSASGDDRVHGSARASDRGRIAGADDVGERGDRRLRRAHGP